MSRETGLDSGASVKDVWFWALKLQFQIFCTGLEEGPRAETRPDYHVCMHLCVHAHICTSARVYVYTFLLHSDFFCSAPLFHPPSPEMRD